MQECTDSSQSHRLSALQSFALSRADTADSTLAIQMMQVSLLLSVMLFGSNFPWPYVRPIVLLLF